MLFDNRKNFCKVIVSTGYDSSAVSIVLLSGEGTKLPDPAVKNFNLVYWNISDYSDPADDPYKSIVRCTGKSTDTLTVVQPAVGNGYNGEGSDNVATNHNIAGKTYAMMVSFTRKSLEDIENVVSIGDLNAATSNIDTDYFSFLDTVAGIFHKMSWANIKATLKTYFDTLYDVIRTVASGAEVTAGTENTKIVTAATMASADVNTRLKSKVFSTTRDMTAASGDVSYTGIGFSPTFIIAMGIVGGLKFPSISVADSSKGTGEMVIAGDSNWYQGAILFEMFTGASDKQSSILKSYDADGVTLTWTKGGTPTGTGNLKFSCMK